MMNSDINLNLFNFSTKLQLRYEEFDAFNHLNNIAYLSCCQFGRVLFFKNELPDFSWERTPFVVLSNLINYYKEILSGITEVEIYVRISAIGNKSITFEHVLTSINLTTKELEINCYNKAVLVRLEGNTRKSIIIEDKLREDFKKLML